MFRFGTGELIIIFLIILLLFGAKKLPEVARAIGKAIREFKKAGREISKDDETEGNEKSE
jgi:sec-independent protein translocase protein TatA